MVLGFYRYFIVPYAFIHWYHFRLDSKKAACLFFLSKFMMSITLCYSHCFMSYCDTLPAGHPTMYCSKALWKGAWEFSGQTFLFWKVS